MGVLDKCCGNCEFFKEEGADGKGWCTHQSWITFRKSACTCFEPKTYGWAEITLDNMNEVDCISKDKVVIGWIRNKEFHSCSLSFFWFTLKAIAMQGGFFYYVLPELKIE
jgi:hypothetical protein